MKQPHSIAGSLNHRITFQKREEIDDGYGGVRGDWVDKFDEPARLKPRMGSETVIASRLQGIQPYTLVVYSSVRTRQVTSAWRAKNARTGTVYDITSIINPDENDAFLEMLVIDKGGG